MLVDFYSKIYRKVLEVMCWVLFPIGAFGGATVGWFIANARIDPQPGNYAAGLFGGFFIGFFAVLLFEMLFVPLVNALISIKENTQTLEDAIPEEEAEEVELPPVPTTEGMIKENQKVAEREARLKVMRASTENLN